ncbi:MAG: type II CAAX endopeptidase family protein [Rhizonema sp. PD38]|nr:type II CAAX endopeptidase family protein [Rhizonema sp. PD38]
MSVLPTFLVLLESLLNSLASFLKDAPALIAVMAFFIAWIGCWLPVVAVFSKALKLQPEQKLPLVISLYLIAPLIVWGASRFTNTNFLDYGLVGNISLLSSLGLGFGLGILSLAIVFTLQFASGWCYFQSHIKQVQSLLLPSLFVALLIGGIEELVFRGFLFTQLTQDYSIWVAAAISSLIFALLHLVWEQRETIPQIPGLWLMGMVLVLARLADGGSLGLAWGLHAGWIWAIASTDTAQLIKYTGIAPEWVTGQNQKPLAGMAGIVCLLLTGLIMVFLCKYSIS